jgi:hypothetical protein
MDITKENPEQHHEHAHNQQKRNANVHRSNIAEMYKKCARHAQ